MSRANNRSLAAMWIVLSTGLAIAAVAALSGCGRTIESKTPDPAPTSTSGESTSSVDQEMDIRYAGYVDFREWATKKPSLAEAEEFLKVKVRAPTDTRGRKLVQIYTLERYSTGEPVARFDQAAILDYGDFTVGFTVCGSAESARTWVDEQVTELGEEVGLTWKVQVGEKTASARKRGTVPIQTDAEGRVTRVGVTIGGNSVSWAEDMVFVSVSSGSVSTDELLKVAQSIDYR